MIAACPKCQTRYRVEPERIGVDGARLRCTQCSTVFRVRKPEAPVVAAPVAPPPRQEPALEAPAQRVVTPGDKAHASEIAPSDFARSEAKSSEASEVPASGAFAPRAASQGRAEPIGKAVVGDGNHALSAEGRFSGASNQSAPEEPLFDHARLVLVAHPSADACKRIAEALEREGLQVLVAHDGVEAILSIQRALPRVVVLDAALPKMFGFQVCELVKRNESLRTIHVCMMGSIHREDRYRRAPNEIYGADFYLEPPALPGALLEWLARLDLPLNSRAASPPRQERTREAPAPREPAPGAKAQVSEIASSDFARSEPKASEALAPKPVADPLSAERAQAERLARIIVSDIVLYNEEKFAAAVRGGNLLESLRDEMAEGRALFRERIEASVREERDYLADELVRVARSRGMQ